MNIRAARKSDLDQWIEMRSELWPASKDEHAGDLSGYFGGRSADIAGFIELSIRGGAEGSLQPKVPYVEGWFVRADFRGRGFGKALMEQAEAWAVERGFFELASDTEINNEKGIAIHKRLGYQETERIVCFLKKLG